MKKSCNISIPPIVNMECNYNTNIEYPTYTFKGNDCFCDGEFFGKVKEIKGNRVTVKPSVGISKQDLIFEF
jgi:hypothetical protein